MNQQDLERYLWGAATALRGTIDAGDYKQFIFPLLFFKRICDVYEEEFQKALEESDGDKDYAAFEENHRFQIPKGAHWKNVREVTTNVGVALQKAMRAIEKANPDTLYGIFGDANWSNKERLSDETLINLIEHFSKHTLNIKNVPDDQLGNGYEYLIKQFADDSGHTAAEFYTNRTVVKLMTLIMDPKSGESVYDPTCGSGGLLLNCALHLKELGKIANDEERDDNLKDIVNEVCKNVLMDNSLQSLAVDIDYAESIVKGWDSFIKGSQSLISKKILHPGTEKVPSTILDWEKWKSQTKGIPKPVLCVLLSYAKMELYNESIRENFFHIEDFPELYFDYFPTALVKKYKVELREHPLKSEILNTQIINFYINLMGFTGISILGDENTKDRMKYLKEILDYLYSLRVDLLLKEIAGFRFKEIEKENVRLCSEIRDRVRAKWGLSRKISLSGNILDSYLSAKARQNIEKI